MNIVLIYPNIGKKNNKSFKPRGIMEPLGLAVLAGMTASEHSVKFYDDRIEEIPYNEPVELVGISVETFTAKRSYAIADKYKKRNVPVVLGGYHPTVMPHEALKHADAIVRGEAEGQWEKIVKDAQNKSLKKIYENTEAADLKGYFPDRTIFKGKKYLKIPLIFFSRGCLVKCNFCALSNFYKKHFNKRPIDDVINEIKALSENFFFFIDDNIATAKKDATKLFQKLIPLKKKWAAQISINHLLDESFIKLMAKSGCKGVLLGIESLKDRSLGDMGKGINQNKDYLTLIRRLQKYGIMHWSSFVFGYDNDEPADIDAALEFTKTASSCLAAFNHLTPYPGTGLYNRLIKENRFIYKTWWIDQDYRFGQVPYKPKNFGVKELSSLCFQARKNFSKPFSILRRALDFKANFGNPSNALFFLASNIVSRKDGREKQGMELG